MTDYDTIREALELISSRGPDASEKIAALAALDRMEKEEKALREKLFGWQAVYAESGRLRVALREIATKTWNPAIGLDETADSQLHNIARRALGEEA